MAIHTAVIQRMAGWFTVEKRMPARVEPVNFRRVEGNPKAIMKASPDEEEEVQRVRKANTDLMKFQTVNRGY